VSAPAFKWLPVVDAARCDGCGRCVEACGPASLEILRDVAVLVHPDTCGSEEHCIPACPTGALTMDWIPSWGDLQRGRWMSPG
jgi:NAD-dependent dihydropyrimidine dehydrogenase PreA subunit